MMSRSTIFRLRLTVWNNNVPNMNNNNNNQSPVMQMRDRLFQVMFIRVSIVYAKVFPQICRTLIENFILFFALMSLFILAYVHITFVHEPMNCLDSVQKAWPREGILRIEVIQKFNEQSYSLQKSYDKELSLRHYQGYVTSHLSTSKKTVLHDVDTKDDISHKIVEEQAADGASAYTLDDDWLLENTSDLLAKDGNSDSFSTWLKQGNLNISKQRMTQGVHETFPMATAKNDDSDEDFQPSGVYIVEYSLEYGFLKLSLAARKQLKIPVKLVVLDPEVDKCFGSWFTKVVLENFLGYDDVLLASLSKLASKEENKGFIRNVVTEHYFRFVNVMNHSSYLLAAAVMLSFTFFISTLLRYSHHQIFIFILQVLRLFEFRATTYVPMASLMTVILALVGMEAIMSEFFSDPATSFYVILIVWIADQFDAICCRTIISRRHWLRFFFLYHFAFYAYDYRFSGQYSDLALFTTCCFIFHSMVYFFHHYELPVILRSLDQQTNPRHHHDNNPHNPNHRPPDAAPVDPVAPEPEASAGAELEVNLLPESEQDASQGEYDENIEVDDTLSQSEAQNVLHRHDRNIQPNSGRVPGHSSPLDPRRVRRRGIIHPVDRRPVNSLHVYDDVLDIGHRSSVQVPKLSELCIREYGLRKLEERRPQTQLLLISR